jgi:hypothetical protein
MPEPEDYHKPQLTTLNTFFNVVVYTLIPAAFVLTFIYSLLLTRENKVDYILFIAFLTFSYSMVEYSVNLLTQSNSDQKDLITYLENKLGRIEKDTVSDISIIVEKDGDLCDIAMRSDGVKSTLEPPSSSSDATASFKKLCESLGAPDASNNAVGLCLAKDPADRFKGTCSKRIELSGAPTAPQTSCKLTTSIDHGKTPGTCAETSGSDATCVYVPGIPEAGGEAWSTPDRCTSSAPTSDNAEGKCTEQNRILGYDYKELFMYLTVGTVIMGDLIKYNMPTFKQDNPRIEMLTKGMTVFFVFVLFLFNLTRNECEYISINSGDISIAPFSKELLQGVQLISLSKLSFGIVNIYKYNSRDFTSPIMWGLLLSSAYIISDYSFINVLTNTYGNMGRYVNIMKLDRMTDRINYSMKFTDQLTQEMCYIDGLWDKTDADAKFRGEMPGCNADTFGKHLGIPS